MDYRQGPVLYLRMIMGMGSAFNVEDANAYCRPHEQHHFFVVGFMATAHVHSAKYIHVNKS